MVSSIGKYGVQVKAPTNNAERWQLCGWAGPDAATAAMSRIVADGPDAGKVFGDTFHRFAVTGGGPAFSGAGKTVRGWEFFRKATGQEPDLTPQPTGSCVACAADDILELTQAVQILHGDLAEFSPIYNPYHYATGRVLIGGNRLRGGAGSLGSWQAKAIEIHGSIPMSAGLPRYTAANVDAWGDDKPAEGKSFRDFLTLGADHVIRTTAEVQSWEQLRDGMVAGHFATIASNRGYTMKPNSAGFHAPSGSWGHQMSIWGFCDTGANPWVAIKNQWGDTMGEIRDFETGELWPKGFLRVRLADFVKYHLSMQGAETFIYSGYEGFPALTFTGKGLV